MNFSDGGIIGKKGSEPDQKGAVRMREAWNGESRVRRGCFVLSAVFAGMLLTVGCGAKKESGLTVGEVRAIVLENAGVSEQDVRFVRIQLDSDHDGAHYEVEFLCGTAEYDYKVDAGTGEILTMNCEAGTYDIAAVPEEILPSGSGQQEPDGSDTLTQGGSDVQNNPDSVIPDGVQTGPQSQTEGILQQEAQYIGTDAAKQAALEHAGLQEEEVRFRHARLEYDDGFWKYEVEFHSDSTEYDYEIDAQSGEILSYDHEAVHGTHGDAAAPAGDMLTAEQAEQIALAYAGAAETDAQYLKAEFDYDDGRAEYEVEWVIGRTEYTCDVDAFTGEILSFERELD